MAATFYERCNVNWPTGYDAGLLPGQGTAAGGHVRTNKKGCR